MLSIGVPLSAESKHPTSGLPGVDPLPATPPTIEIEDLEAFFTRQKKGAPLQLTLSKGQVVKGLFSSYDEYYQTVWIIPRGTDKGVFSQKGIKLAGIKSVGVWDRAAPKPQTRTPSGATQQNVGLEDLATDEYFLLKESGLK